MNLVRLQWALWAVAVGACAAPPVIPKEQLLVPLETAAPAACRKVSVSEPLGALLEKAQPGEAFCLEEGTWKGQFVVPQGVSVWGTQRSVLQTAGIGTTVLLHSQSSLRGLIVDGSGGRFDVLDAAVKLNGDEITVEGLTVRNSVFGILSEKSKKVIIRGNHVVGIGGTALGLRGDGIRLWETRDSLVERNRVEAARDCVVWYSTNNVLTHNEVRDGRYGVHFMYSHSNRAEHNLFVGNEVGVFIMYSRNVTLEDNRLLFSRGAAGMGLGVKESGNLVIRNNLIAHNTQGIFLDNSPLTQGDRNLFEHNTIRLSELGVGFLSSQHDNTFVRNAFLDNRVQVRVDGGGDALSVQWTENEWSDYAGYDLDGDGLGDLPYELKDLSAALSSKFPDLAFFTGTPALALVSVAGEVVPLFAPKPVLRDERPRFSSGDARAN